jgi:serine/threonine protein kinase
MPFPGQTLPEIQKSIIFNDPCKFTKNISPKLQALILSTLHKDQFLRITIERLWNHPLFNTLREIANRPKPCVILQTASLKSTKGLLIENGICLEKNINEISEFGEKSDDENSLYCQQRRAFCRF